MAIASTTYNIQRESEQPQPQLPTAAAAAARALTTSTKPPLYSAVVCDLAAQRQYGFISRKHLGEEELFLHKGNKSKRK
jgi:hypothetical protein